jgi:transcriptional regulator with PAS, ATPase and Fis domain
MLPGRGRVHIPTSSQVVTAIEKRRPSSDLRNDDGILQAAFDALDANIAVLDERGTIIAVNAGWGRFADVNGLRGAGDFLGVSYLDVCDAAGAASAEARAAAAGIRAVIAGKRREFSLAYPCCSPTARRWFQMRVTRFERHGGTGIVIAHQPIGEFTQAQENLQKTLTELARLRERLQAENLYLQEEIRGTDRFHEMVGESVALKKVFHEVEQVAPTDTNILILGETGTGKELIARAIHCRSTRRERPLVKVNCAALPSTLIESEFFGHEKGAFTGALARKIGRFELADGGTIFLDEIGDLALELQAKLLRVLQEGEFERIGSTQTLKVDTRVIAATNRKLEREVAGGTFRSDLFYRLSVFPIELPPLRARGDDIPLLVWYFIDRSARRLGKRITDVARKTMEALTAYSWPGNIRELENVIERAVILSPGPVLRVNEPLARAGAPHRAAATSGNLQDVERAHILRVIAECGGRIKGKGNAAERLGLNPSTLRSRMKKLHVESAMRRHRDHVAPGGGHETTAP